MHLVAYGDVKVMCELLFPFETRITFSLCLRFCLKLSPVMPEPAGNGPTYLACGPAAELTLVLFYWFGGSYQDDFFMPILKELNLCGVELLLIFPLYMQFIKKIS